MSSIERLPRDGNICLIDADSLIYYEMHKPTLEEALYGIDERYLTCLGLVIPHSMWDSSLRRTAFAMVSLLITKVIGRVSQSPLCLVPYVST